MTANGAVVAPSITPRAVRGEVAAAVDRMLGRDHGLDVHVHVVHAASAATLVAASAHADLLVVASRGRGGFSGLLVGSTSEQVVRHADCPVVVIRG